MAEDNQKFLLTNLTSLIGGITALIVALTTMYITCKKIESSNANPTKTDTNNIIAPVKIDKIPTPQNEDVFEIVNISPAINTTLSSANTFSVNIHIRYELYSSNSAIIIATLEQFFKDDECGSGTHHSIGQTTPDKISIKKGKGELTLNINSLTNDNSTVKKVYRGFGHVSPNASLWVSEGSKGNLRLIQANLWDMKSYCFPFDLY